MIDFCEEMIDDYYIENCASYFTIIPFQYESCIFLRIDHEDICNFIKALNVVDQTTAGAISGESAYASPKDSQSQAKGQKGNK